MLTIASSLAERHDVSIFWDHNGGLLEEAGKRFDLQTRHIKLVPNIFTAESSLFVRLLQTNSYDAIFYLSDGSIPWLFARRNFLFFQFPVNWVNGNDISTKLKLAKISKVISNSYFVKSFIDDTFHLKSLVIPPPVRPIPEKSVKKENIILTVGRFTQGMNMKKQEELIQVFKNMYDDGLDGWRFVLIGSTLPQDAKFLEFLRKKANKYPIEILSDIPWTELIEYYQKAKIYWHGAGYGEDLRQHPERAEHFGISTVEAMSAGCVPIVFNGGGQKEIVENGECGFVWDSQDELQLRTRSVIKNKQLRTDMSAQAKKRALVFSDKKFIKSIADLLV